MPLRVLVISDTHVPARAHDLPAQVWHEVDSCDVVIHAGDWVETRLLDTLEARARHVIGVAGNNDEPELAARLPQVATPVLGDVSFVVLHDSGPAQGRDARLTARFPDADVVVFGHSHIPWDSIGPTGARILNPGSPTDRRHQPVGSYLTLTVDAGAVRDVMLHPIDGR